MNRRPFITGMSGIIGAGAAPAIIHNAMKIVVPRREISGASLRRYPTIYESELWDAAQLQREVNLRRSKQIDLTTRLAHQGWKYHETI